jgi:hypothetical protein
VNAKNGTLANRDPKNKEKNKERKDTADAQSKLGVVEDDAKSNPPKDDAQSIPKSKEKRR